MSTNDFNRFGEELKDTIDSAVESGDFKDLSIAISRIMNEAIDQVKDSIPVYLDEGQRKAREWTSQQNKRLQEQYKESEARRMQEQRRLQNDYKEQFSRNARRNRRSWEASFDRRRQTSSAGSRLNREESLTYNSRERKAEIAPFKDYFAPSISRIKPTLMAGLGGLFCFDFLSMGLGTLTLGFHGFGSLLGGLVGTAVSFGLAALSGVVCSKGVKELGRISRFRHYSRVAARQENIPVKTLAKKVNRSFKQTVKDLNYMIDKNWFYEGHLDEDEGYFLLTDQAYREYVNMKADSLAKVQEAEAKKEAEKQDDEVSRLIREGEAYVAHIRTCNNQIPNQEITKKLDHMEMLVKRIFEEIKTHPEVSSDMGRMMSYYLPTTAKLLDAYRDLDLQPVEGENIATTKKEIEDSIDMLNTAFEKFLDGLFADRAMDISTDISVLNTLLAQEGLKEDDFHLSMKQDS